MRVDDIAADIRLRTYRRFFDSFECLIDRERTEAKQQFRYAFFLRYYATFESRLKLLCDRFAQDLSLPLRLSDISGDNFLKRVNKYLTHVAKFDPLDKHQLWNDALTYLWLRNLIIHSDGRVAHAKDVPQYVSRQFRHRSSGLKLEPQCTIRLNRNFCYRAVSRMAALLLEVAQNSRFTDWSLIDKAWEEIRTRKKPHVPPDSAKKPIA